MVRTRLTVLILVLLGNVLLVSGALVWTVARAQYHLGRSQISHDELDAYHSVAEAALQGVRIRLADHEAGDVDGTVADIGISGVEANRDDLAETETQLRKNLEALKAMTKRESAFVDRDKQAEESTEIGGVEQLTGTINAILDQQHKIGRSVV